MIDAADRIAPELQHQYHWRESGELLAPARKRWHNPGGERRNFAEWASEGRIRPHVSHGFPLAEFKTAMLSRWNGEVIGGCVLRP